MQSLTLSDSIQNIDAIDLESIWVQTVLHVNHVTCIEGQFFKTNSRETTLDRGQSKMLILSMKVDQNSLETESFRLPFTYRQMAIKNTVPSDFWQGRRNRGGRGGGGGTGGHAPPPPQ